MKVGKAIYNILSRAIPVQQNIGFSTDTFAPSGEELVTNGNFSATGSELVTNGDFANDSNWNKGTGWSIANDKASCDGSQSSNSNLYQSLYTVNKSYKTTINVIRTAGTLKIFTGTPSGTLTITANGSYEYIGTASSSTTLYIQAQSDFVGSVTNVSVKELGAGWTLGTGWSIGNLKAISNGSQTAQSNLYQTGIVPINKTYKVVFDIVVNAGSMVVAVGGSNAQPTITSTNTYTYYTKATGGDSNFYFSAGSTFVGSVTNVSVQEMVLTKIFPEIAPPDINPPYIVYSVVSNQPSNTKNENGEIDEASLEVYSFQDTYNKTVDLGVAVRASLDRVNGTFATVKVDSINYTNEQMDVNESRKLWAAIQDYTVRIKNI